MVLCAALSPSIFSPNWAFLCISTRKNVHNTEPQKGSVRMRCKKRCRATVISSGRVAHVTKRFYRRVLLHGLAYVCVKWLVTNSRNCTCKHQEMCSVVFGRACTLKNPWNMFFREPCMLSPFTCSSEHYIIQWDRQADRRMNRVYKKTRQTTCRVL